MKTEITAASVSGPANTLERLRAIEADLRAVGRIVAPIAWTPGDAALHVDAELAPAQ
jgi:valyl-tRNA synthetase